VDIGTIVQAKRQMTELINRFRDKGLLAKKINKGYFSNSFTVLNEKGRKIKKYGVFLKTATK
jgi:predicted transcriptional regulator YheO